MEADEAESRRKRREGEDSLRRWAVEVKRREDAFAEEAKKRDAALQKERDEVRAAKGAVDDARANLVQDARSEKARALKEVEAARERWQAEAEEERKKTEEQRAGVAKQLRLKSEKLEALEKELRKELDVKKARLEEERELVKKDRVRGDEAKAEAERGARGGGGRARPGF